MSEPLFNEATGWSSETLSKIDPGTDVPELSNESLCEQLLPKARARKHTNYV